MITGICIVRIITLLLMTIAFNEIQESRPSSPRYWRGEIKREVIEKDSLYWHKADSVYEAAEKE